MQFVAFFSGIFIIVASVLDWDWFFNHWKASPFVSSFGRNGARVFYLLLGSLLIFIGRLYRHLPAGTGS